MKIISTDLDGVLVLVRDLYHDSRGYFMESFRETDLPVRFVQDNVSCSKKNVIRGLHYQISHPQAKLVGVLRGSIVDVAVDIRDGSPNFGRWVSRVLSQKNGEQLFIPDGFAHGFCALEDDTIVQYKCSDVYCKEGACSIRWNDPQINIDWGNQESPIVSEVDGKAPFLADARLPHFIGNLDLR